MEIWTKLSGTAELLLSLQDYCKGLKDRIFNASVFQTVFHPSASMYKHALEI